MENQLLKGASDCLGILSYVAQNPDATLTKIADNLGETKPKVLRGLRTLIHHDLVRKRADNTYRLGIGTFVLGIAASSQVDLVRVAMPLMEELGQRINETVQLSIVEGGQSLCIAKFEPSRDLRVHARVGRKRPLYAGSRKVLLAHMPRSVQERILPETVELLSGCGTRSKARMLKELDQIRAQGHCVSHGEINEQLSAVSVPILSEGGSLLGSMNVALPTFRAGPEVIDLYAVLLKRAAREIVHAL